MLTITATAAEIKTLAANPEATENLFIWNDGADNWMLERLADALGEEALFGKGVDSTITLTAVDLQFEGCNAFVEGFRAFAPDCYDFEADTESGSPWCAPWFWTVKPDWFNSDLTPYEMGKAFAESCREEIEEMFAEESNA